MLPQQTRQATAVYQWKAALNQFACDLRVALPGIIQSFDAVEGTATVRPAIIEMVRQDAVPTMVSIPDIPDVPIVIPRAGGFSLTLPVRPGDECLIVFADMCIDEWWQSGCADGQPQGQLWRRRHDLSDAFAILGPWSQPRRLTAYSTASAQLRSDDGSVVVDVGAAGVTVTAPAVSLVSPAVSIGPSGGTPSALMTKVFFDWFTTNIVPFLTSKGYAGPAAPAGSYTANITGE